MTRYLTCFESAWDGTVFPPDTQATWHAGRPLWVRYDLERLRAEVRRTEWESRAPNMWRFRELLPVGDEIEPISLHEDATPLVACPQLGAALGLSRLWIKDESRLSGCSFKARGLSLAITMARHSGVTCVAMASNGNAGGSMASYAARGGLKSVVVVPKETPRANVAESILCGARVFRAVGTIDQCGKVIRQGHERGLWFDISTMKEPYRLEGKKTMGLELALQMRWQLPDVIVYPTGGGTALIAMWKAFQELRSLGWLDSATMPRMVAAQSTGCTPIVTA
ncbi:MAG TPA: threonine synthase, partial [Pirellulaceae bacterium]|nr:threonine synthase [Pirellulaceae bacterium]